jgi:hypothetical protein
MARKIYLVILFFIVIAILGRVFTFYYTDWLWFKELEYTIVFWRILAGKITLGILAAVFFFIILYSNIRIARRLAPPVVLDTIVTRILRSPFVIKYFELIALLASLALSTLVGLSASLYWETYLKYFNATPFGIKDPIFSRDIGFYVFRLPFLRYLQMWLLNSLLLTIIVTAFTHWFSGSIGLGRTLPRFSSEAKAHLSILAGITALIIAWKYRLDLFELLFSPTGVVFGAGYTDVFARLPALKILAGLSVFIALLFIVNLHYRGWRLPLVGIVTLLTASFIIGVAYPAIVQQYRVAPNELAREKKFIEHNIRLTRKAYDLDKVAEKNFPATNKLTLEEIKQNKATIENIRLWDWRPLIKTYQQIQSIRLYYDFEDVDVDRYFIDGAYRQLTISARELNTDRLAEAAQTWVNKHLVFTHGYGVVANQVNTISEEGLPELIIKDIPPETNVESLKINRPEIYYGEKTDDFVVVKTKTKEFDYPKGDKNVYTRYQGTGGIQIGSIWRKAALAWRLGSLQFLLSDAITNQSRVMFYRKLSERVSKLAPFLTFDHDPYIVIAKGRLFWIQDAYTTTDQFPYSKPFEHGNYIRNSVKIAMDAYNGSVKFYLVDEEDPLIKTYSRIFPGLFRPFKEMPAWLKKHLRYPEELFKIQSRLYAAYHMKDPQVFYNREDLWTIPEEVFGNGTQPLEPYYVIIKLPGVKQEEFLLITPYTPVNKNNMVAWLAARSDFPNYGSLLVFKFPKKKLVFGPMQVEARVDQNPRISEQLTLWSQRGSSVIRGNLLVIPIEQSLLYVEPLYLQAEQSELPELKRVILAFGPKVVMESDLEAAIQAAFLGRKRPQIKRKPEVEVTVEDLIKKAVNQFKTAQEALKNGDFATYGEQIKKLGNTLKKLERKRRELK